MGRHSPREEGDPARAEQSLKNPRLRCATPRRSAAELATQAQLRILPLVQTTARWTCPAAASINRPLMRIDQVVGRGKPTISFEFFPPKNEAGFQQLYRAIDELHPLHPTYVSVTYGAGGSTRKKTVELVEKIQNALKTRAMAHLTCVGHTADKIGGILDALWKAGIVNVLALRGDPP